jgi:hypothetical protein
MTPPSDPFSATAVLLEEDEAPTAMDWERPLPPPEAYPEDIWDDVTEVRPPQFD